MFSQNTEELYILDFFRDKSIGRCLDIGAYNPETFSNTKALIDQGWEAVLVEPSPECFKKIEEYYKGNKNIQVINSAISDFDGKLEFWNSEGACATAIEDHYNLWKEATKDYNKITVDALSWYTFYKQFPGTYDFISIDTEGMDYNILKQINLFETKTQLICIEFNYNATAIVDYLKLYGFTNLLYHNSENILVSRGK